MAKVKIQAGAEIDTLNKREMEGILRDWMTEAIRGVKYPLISGNAAIVGAALSITIPGPLPGYLWSIKRLQVTGLSGTDTVTLGLNDAGPMKSVQAAIAGPAWYAHWGSNVLVVEGGNHLIISGSSLASTGQVYVSGQVKEVPATLAWQL
jgi:hypothetical protein